MAMSNTNISCSECATTNRIPDDRLSDQPKCGRCKRALFDGKPLVLTSANVATTLQHNDIPVLVDCWAPWCGPCRSFAPTFEKAALELEPTMRLAKLDTQDQQSVASRWQIRSIPTLILFHKGKEKARVSGALSLSQLKQWVNENM